MFSGTRTSESTKSFSAQIKRLSDELKSADTVIIGAGAGLSTSAGYEYSGKRFTDNFSDFKERYGIQDMYTGGFYPFETLEEYWAWWSRHIYLNRYVDPPKDTYKRLLELVRDKDYFVITTNTDHVFQKSGFDKKRLYYTQGDYGLWQCLDACHDKTYDNEQTVFKMLKLQKDMKVPSELVPKCPVCGKPMTMNLRIDDKFVQDEGWYKAAERYDEFLRRHKNTETLFLELGVGFNTPGIIKYPFWKMAYTWRNACYAVVNKGGAYLPKELSQNGFCIDADIDMVINACMAI